jgi:hypothetical protein
LPYADLKTAIGSIHSDGRLARPVMDELGIGWGDSRNSDFYEILMAQVFLLTTF